MKKLQTIKLINWHTFQNQTIKIDGNVLISGENGCGKSTLLDAVQYVLSGGRPKFNQAANEKCTRTVESYIRGKLNTDKKDCLRDGDVTAYIALEFVNDSNQRKDIIGVVMELANSSRLNKTFFKISDINLQDDLFIEANAPKTLWNFKREKENKIEFFDTKQDIQRMICSILGLSGNKYFELLQKALAFKPIDNINDFVNSFLLPEENIKIDNLNQNVEHLRSLLDIVEIEEEKVVALEIIETKYQEYQKNLTEQKKQEYLKENIEREKIKREIDELESKNKNLLLEIDKLSNEQKDYIQQKDNVIILRKMYKENNENNEQTKIYYNLSDEQEKLKQMISSLEPQYKNYQKNLSHEKNNLKIFPWANNFLKIDLSDINTTKEILSNIYESAQKEKESLTKFRIEFENRKKQINEEIIQTESKISILKNKKMPYEEMVNNLIHEIKTNLSDKYNTNIEVRPLCEYLEITNDEWRNAIEGYLNNQRFDLIIDPIYFDDALKIYEEKKKEKKIYNVGLVNTKKYIKDGEIEADTLANYVKSDNIYARRYANYLLNRVKCCEKVEELKNHKQAITKTCMTYRNHVARQINPKVYEYYFIGATAKVQQLEKYEQARVLEIELKNEIITKCNNLANQYNKLDNSNLLNLIQELPIIDEYHKNKNSYQTITNNINDLMIEGFINNIKEQIDKFNQEEDNLTTKINDSITKILELEAKIESNDKELNIRRERLLDKKVQGRGAENKTQERLSGIQNKEELLENKTQGRVSEIGNSEIKDQEELLEIGNKENSSENKTQGRALEIGNKEKLLESESKAGLLEPENKDNLLEIQNADLDIPEGWIEELNKMIQDKKIDLEKLTKKVENTQEKIKMLLNNEDKEICIKLNDYNNKFSFDEIANIDNIDTYLDELFKIRDHNLIKHKSAIQNFKEQCQISFREDFISKLKDKIENSIEEIKNLNKSLKKQKFGKERYEFICKRSDNPEMGMYYDIITSGKNYTSHNLFEENLTTEQQDCMDALFNRITSSHTKEMTDKTVQEYTDYRKYMSYDIKVTNEDGDSYYFSTCAKEKSGGEVQTPFYVIIASSFEQLLRTGRRNDSVGAIVLFDEAFNNMDENRISAMMKFYSDLNIQLLIAVPPERVPSIATYVNTILIINSNNNNSTVSEIGIEECNYE